MVDRWLGFMRETSLDSTQLCAVGHVTWADVAGWVGVGHGVGLGVGDWSGCDWGDRVAFRRSNKQNLSFKIKSDVLSIKRLLNEDVRLR